MSASLPAPTASRTISHTLWSLFTPTHTTQFASLSLPSSSTRPSPSSSSSLPSSSATPSPVASVLHGLWELFPSIVLAVPKKRTSHSKKRRRATNKQLEDKHHIDSCRACGLPKLRFQLCANCRSQITRDLKNEKRVKEMFKEAIARGEDPYALHRVTEGQAEAEGAGEVELAPDGAAKEKTP